MKYYVFGVLLAVAVIALCEYYWTNEEPIVEKWGTPEVHHNSDGTTTETCLSGELACKGPSPSLPGDTTVIYK